MIVREPRIKVSTMQDAILRLRTSIEGSEQSHGCSSESMLKSIRADEIPETPDIGLWLTEYHVLKKLERQYGRTAGIPTKATRQSTSHS